MTPIFDTHAHYDDEAFDEDREEILSSLAMHGVAKVCDIGAGIESSKTALELSKKYDWMYCALGVIPGKCSEINDETWEWLVSSARDEEKCVAIGEIGLDYHWDDDPKDVQAMHFVNQMDLARSLRKPIVVHSRDAANDTINIMKEHKASEIGGVIHCYSYTRESAREFLNMGFYFGIGGVVTFKNARKLIEAVQYIPLSAIVLETDCPYLAPVPHRGERNYSGYLPLVADAIAQIKNIPFEKVIEQTWQNAHSLYKIDEL
ncbi:MAG: TatD family hydrolase [Lachnospiraceae bacterium]|nr:TatD family hydrolase [Lachnospiraceae bacterium]